MDKRAQQVLEYMVVVGVALTIIVIVLLFLYYKGIFNPLAYSPPVEITGFQGMPVLTVAANSSQVRMVIENNNDIDVNITGLWVIEGNSSFDTFGCVNISLVPQQQTECVVDGSFKFPLHAQVYIEYSKYSSLGAYLEYNSSGSIFINKQ